MGFSRYQSPSQLLETIGNERKLKQLQWDLDPDTPNAAQKTGIERESPILNAWFEQQPHRNQQDCQFPGFYTAMLQLTANTQSVQLPVGCSPDAVIESEDSKTMLEVKWTGGRISSDKLRAWEVQTTFNAQLLGCDHAIVIYQVRNTEPQWHEVPVTFSSPYSLKLWHFGCALREQLNGAG